MPGLVTTVLPAATRSMARSSITTATSGRYAEGCSSSGSSIAFRRAISRHMRGSLNQPVAPRSIHQVPKLRIGLLADVADQLPVRILQRAHGVDRAGEITGAQVGPGVVLVEPHLAGQGHALGRRHRGSALPQAAIEVRDRRAEHVDVGRIEHAAERVVTRDRRTGGDGGELEEVAVEEDHELPAARGRPHRVGQVADALAHRLLLELGPVDQRLARARDRGRLPAGAAWRRAGEGASTVSSLALASCHAA